MNQHQPEKMRASSRSNRPDGTKTAPAGSALYHPSNERCSNVSTAVLTLRWSCMLRSQPHDSIKAKFDENRNALHLLDLGQDGLCNGGGSGVLAAAVLVPGVEHHPSEMRFDLRGRARRLGFCSIGQAGEAVHNCRREIIPGCVVTTVFMKSWSWTTTALSHSSKLCIRAKSSPSCSSKLPGCERSVTETFTPFE